MAGTIDRSSVDVPGGLDPTYLAARRTLLDALGALEVHRAAVVVAGAQAVYLRTGDADIGIAPYTTDGDVALDPSQLGAEPEIESAMRAAGFHLDQGQPGAWLTTARVGERDLVIPVDLLVPEAVAGAGTRGARLGVHGKRAARRAAGLEAALIDRSVMTIDALEANDSRSADVSVAGIAALFVAKAHKIADRAASPGRLSDKDAADVYRLMQVSAPSDVAATLIDLRGHPVAGAATDLAIGHLVELFGTRRAEGVAMASRTLRLGIPESQIRTVSTSFIAMLMDALADPA